MVTQNPNLYLRITDLPLHKFITCLVDNDLSALIISGTPTEYELQEAWVNIYEEYVDAIGNQESKMQFSLFKEISILEIRYNSINVIIDILLSATSINNKEVLESNYSKKLALELNSLLKINFHFNPDDIKKYSSDLERCRNRSQALKIQFDLKMSEYEGMLKKTDKKSEKITASYFQSILIALSNHAKYQLTDRITVFEYCERIKQFNNYYESVKNQRK